jgi:hypothetical protein
MNDRRPAISARAAVSLTIALLSGVAAYHFSHHGGLYDFDHYMIGGRALVERTDPYAKGFVYPLPAAMWGALFASLPRDIGAALFVASSFGSLSFALTIDSWYRLPILLSGPALWCVYSGQWAPLILAAALSPAFAWAAAAKPTLGLAAFVYRPSKWFMWVGLATIALSLVIMHDWPMRWLDVTKSGHGGKLWSIPLLQPFGFLLALSAVRWRTPDGRLLLVMSCVPQSMLIYDQFPLLLIARTRAQSLAFSVYTAVIPLLVAFLTMPDTLSAKNGTAATFPFWARSLTLTMYLPALAVVLSRSSEPHRA